MIRRQLTSLALLVAICIATLLPGCLDGEDREASPPEDRPTAPPAVERSTGIQAADFSLISSSIRPHDTGVLRDMEIHLGFDEAVDPESLQEARAVLVLEVATGAVVDLLPWIDETDPRQLVLTPRGPSCLAAETDYRIVIADGGVLGPGLRSVAGHTLSRSLEIPFRTGAEFARFHALAVSPVDGASLWRTNSPTQITIQFSKPVDTSDLSKRLLRAMYRTGSAVSEEGRWVPMRYRPTADASSLSLVTQEPLPPGVYGIRVGGFVSAGTRDESIPWTVLFSVKERESMQIELAPACFVDRDAPRNLAGEANIGGPGLNDAALAIDGRTAAEDGRPAWLQTDGRGDASEPRLELEWVEPVLVAEIVIDTDDVRWNRDHRRVLHAYRVLVQEEDPDTGESLLRQVAAVSDAMGDHSVTFEPPVHTRKIVLSHCRTLFDGIFGVSNPVVYEIGVFDFPVSIRGVSSSYQDMVDIGVTDESVAFGAPIYHGRRSSSRDAAARGAVVSYSEVLSAPGEELVVSAARESPEGMWHSVLIGILPLEGGPTFDLECIEIPRTSILDER